MGEQWRVHLFPIAGEGVLAEDSCLTFDGTQLWFRRRESTMPENAAITWIGGRFRAQAPGCEIEGLLRTLPELNSTVLHGTARGLKTAGAPVGDDIDSFVAVRAGGDGPEKA